MPSNPGLECHARSAQALPIHNYSSVLRVLVDDASVVTGESLWWYLITLSRKSHLRLRESFSYSNPSFLYEIAVPYIAGASPSTPFIARTT